MYLILTQTIQTTDCAVHVYSSHYDTIYTSHYTAIAARVGVNYTRHPMIGLGHSGVSVCVSDSVVFWAMSEGQQTLYGMIRHDGFPACVVCFGQSIQYVCVAVCVGVERHLWPAHSSPNISHIAPDTGHASHVCNNFC